MVCLLFLCLQVVDWAVVDLHGLPRLQRFKNTKKSYKIIYGLISCLLLIVNKFWLTELEVRNLTVFTWIKIKIQVQQLPY